MKTSTFDHLKFSVCIPTYKRGPDLFYTIKSVVEQSYPHWELNILDDSPDDDTLSLVNQFNNKKINYFKNSERLGLVRNWNQCLKSAQNEYCMILHHDDFLLKDGLLIYKRFIDNFPEAKFIHANSYNANLPFGRKVVLIPKKKKIVLNEGDEGILDIMFRYGITCSTVVMHTSIFNKIGYYDEDCWVSPDWEYSARIAKHFKTYFIENPTAVYVYHYNNTHTSGYDVNIFADQSRYHYQKVKGYLSNPHAGEISNDDGLLDAIKGLAVMMFIDGKYSKSIKFFMYSWKRVTVKTLIYTLVKRAIMISKLIFFKRTSYKELFEKNFVKVS